MLNGVEFTLHKDVFEETTGKYKVKLNTTQRVAVIEFIQNVHRYKIILTEAPYYYFNPETEWENEFIEDNNLQNSDYRNLDELYQNEKSLVRFEMDEYPSGTVYNIVDVRLPTCISPVDGYPPFRNRVYYTNGILLYDYEDDIGTFSNINEYLKFATGNLRYHNAYYSGCKYEWVGCVFQNVRDADYLAFDMDVINNINSIICMVYYCMRCKGVPRDMVCEILTFVFLSN